jgi:integrase
VKCALGGRGVRLRMFRGVPTPTRLQYFTAHFHVLSFWQGLARSETFHHIEGEGLGEVNMAQGKTRRASKTLTAALIRSELAPGKYHDGGGLGLYLRVEKNGARFWIQRLTIEGKRHELGLGAPPATSLAEVRERASGNKQLVRSGGSPLAEKRRALEARETMTFAEAVEKYLEGKLAEFRNEKHRKQWRATLDTYARPLIGSKSVADIEMRDVLRVLEPIWAVKTETAIRLRGRIEAVLSWATVAGHRAGDNPARWKGNLSEMLAKPSKVATIENMPAVALGDAPRWWRDLAGRDGMGARALQFLTMAAARSGEVRGMTWDEVDLDVAMWRVPAERMKMRKEHRVPLTAEAVVLLRALPTMHGSPFVFFAERGGQMSDMTLSAVMRRMQESEIKRLKKVDAAAGRETSTEPRGYIDPRNKRPAVPHGLRSTFSDWAAEQGFDHTLAEMALAHVVGSEVERAYRRTDLVERRRAMLASWGRFLRGESTGQVVDMRGAGRA